jgi:hypothetical protein
VTARADAPQDRAADGRPWGVMLTVGLSGLVITIELVLAVLVTRMDAFRGLLGTRPH